MLWVDTTNLNAFQRPINELNVWPYNERHFSEQIIYKQLFHEINAETQQRDTKLKMTFQVGVHIE